MLRLVLDHELPVSELVVRTGMKQPAVSQHLKILRETGLMKVRIDGPRRLYRVDFEGLERLRTELGEFWSASLDALRAAAEGNDKP
jgi:DNA-binding transcriptional ArsR family regulator